MPTSPEDAAAIQTQGQVGEQVSAQETAGVRIPVIVARTPQAVILKPFDLMITPEGDTQPLTEQRIAEVMSAASQFSAATKPEIAGSEMSGEQTIFRGSGSTQELPKLSSLLEDIAPGLGNLDKVAFFQQLDTPEYRYALENFPNFRDAVTELYNEKTASAEDVQRRAIQSLVPTAMLVEKTASGYRVTSAAANAYYPVVTEVPAREASAFPPGVLREVHQTGLYMQSPADADDRYAELESLSAGHTKEAGLHRVPCGASDWSPCAVVPVLYDTQARKLDGIVVIEADEQADGHRVRRTDSCPLVGGMEKVAGMPNDEATFAAVQAELESTTWPKVAMFVAPDLSSGIGPVKIAQVMSVQGRQRLFIDQGVEVIKTASLVRPARTEKALLVPEDWYPVTISDQPLQLADADIRKTAALASAKNETITVFQTGAARYDVTGGCGVSSLAESDRSNLTKTSALLLLGCLGFSRDYAEGIVKQASRGMKSSSCSTSRKVEGLAARKTRVKAKLSGAKQALPKVNLVKEAALLAQTQSVDQMLAVGFINDDNVQAFLDKRGELEQTLRGMCVLLVAVRYGLEDVPEAAVERSVKGLTQVIDGLNALEARMQTPS